MTTAKFKMHHFAFAGCLIIIATLIFSFKSPEKVKVGFLVHDLVAERWKLDMDNFSKKIQALGGEPITRNGLGDAHTQVAQGKKLIDEGVKVIAVVPQDGKVLGELVAYAEKAGATIIAYDRMITDCNLNYYISFNSVKVGELMAGYALKVKPKGNYVILNGPSSDNNALLVRKGVMNVLKKEIAEGNIKILIEKEMESWYELTAQMFMDEFVAGTKEPIDAIIASSDGIASGAIDALRGRRAPLVVTGQDASLDACRNIVSGYQSMTIYKSIKKLSEEAAILSMKIAKGQRVNITTTVNNGTKEVPSILFDPVVVDKENLHSVVVADGHIKAEDLK